MIDLKTYAIRRAILRTLQRAEGAPMCAEDMKGVEVMELEPELKRADFEEVRIQFNTLKTHGYIAPIAGFTGNYCELSITGAQQLSVEFKQDALIWGPTAK